MKQTDSYTITDELEELFSRNLKCESTHPHPHMGICSVEVTAKIFSCDGSALICETLAQADIVAMNLGVICLCGNPAADCWRVIPV